MDFTWINTTWTSLTMVILSAIGIYISLILFTRIAGLRSFSKMSGFDFAVTVALGSVIASTILTKDPPLLQAIIALASLYSIQMGVAKLRESNFAQYFLDNKPILLMQGTEMIEENMKKAKVSRSDILGKLREANVTQIKQVKAVVMETTGDVSVLHHEDEQHDLDEILMEDVR